MRLKLIACKVLYREVSCLTYNSKNIIDVTYLRQGYHNTPDLLRDILQGYINRLDSGEDEFSYKASEYDDFDAILLGYGLCSNALAGLKSRRYKLVVPRAHDCITLFIGNKERYKELFYSERGGIYWYTNGWIEQTSMPGMQRDEKLKLEYAEKYGEDNADYLLEMEKNWVKEYSLAGYIKWDELNNERFAEYTKESANYLNWNFEEINGSSRLLRDFLDGNWSDEEFLVVQPGDSIEQSYDDTIITTQGAKMNH